MLQDNIYKVFFKYIIPSILGLLAISSASIVDGYFIGNYVGHVALASINIAYPIFSLLLGFTLMFAVGNSVVFAKLFGEKKIQEGLNVFSKTLIAILFFSIIVCLLIYLNLNHIFYFMGVEGELRRLTTSYLGIILFFLPFLMVGIVVDYFVRADENPNLSFAAMLGSAILNVVLDYVLIVKFNYGLKGAAYATGLSFTIVIFILLPHFFSKKHTLRFIKPVGSFMITLKALKNGLSEFINESSAGITVLIFNIIIIKYLGAKGVSAYTIVSYFIMIHIMISFAIGDGLQPIIAKHFGAKKFTRIYLFLKLAFGTIISFSLIFVVFVLVFPEFFINIFLNENGTDVQLITEEFLKYAWVAFVFLGINILITSYLTSIHQPLASASISILRSLILPILFIGILSYYFGVIGIYMTMAFSECVTFVIALYFFKKFKLQKE